MFFRNHSETYERYEFSPIRNQGAILIISATFKLEFNTDLIKVFVRTAPEFFSFPYFPLTTYLLLSNFTVSINWDIYAPDVNKLNYFEHNKTIELI